jgi:hypothetical protein
VAANAYAAANVCGFASTLPFPIWRFELAFGVRAAGSRRTFRRAFQDDIRAERSSRTFEAEYLSQIFGRTFKPAGHAGRSCVRQRVHPFASAGARSGHLLSASLVRSRVFYALRRFSTTVRRRLKRKKGCTLADAALRCCFC